MAYHTFIAHLERANGECRQRVGRSQCVRTASDDLHSSKIPISLHENAVSPYHIGVDVGSTLPPRVQPDRRDDCGTNILSGTLRVDYRLSQGPTSCPDSASTKPLSKVPPAAHLTPPWLTALRPTGPRPLPARVGSETHQRERRCELLPSRHPFPSWLNSDAGREDAAALGGNDSELEHGAAAAVSSPRRRGERCARLDAVDGWRCVRRSVLLGG